MAVEITVPRLGWSMEEGIFREWLVAEGAPVQPGQALFVLESDKAAQEVESFDAGILAVPQGAPAPGERVVVGQLLGFLLGEGEAVPAYRQPESSPPPALAPSPDAPATAPASAPRAELPPRHRVPVTPRARRTAREMGVDPKAIRGSGRGGRIRERDILASARTFRSGEAGTITFITARALAGDFDATVAEVAENNDGYSRENLFTRLLLVALHEYPGLHAGEPVELGRTFGLAEFSGRRIEHWAPEIPAGCAAALGIGRAVGDPLVFPLNLSFNTEQVALEEAIDFLEFLCDLVESPMLGLVR